MTRPTRGVTLLAALVLAGFGVAPWSVRYATAEQVVQYRNDKLTVRLTAVPVATMLDEVARATGATIHGRLEEAPEVTASFEELPLDEGMRRLLPKQGFALKYDGDRVAAIELLDASGVVQPPFAPAVIRDPGQSPADAAVQNALGALAIARQNGMAPESMSPLEAALGASAPAP